MSSRLPVEIDPESLVEKQSELSGLLALSSFARLSESLVVDQGSVEVIVSFRKEGDIKAISGHVSAILSVQCQRCLEPVSLCVDRDFKLAIVYSDEQAKHLPDIYDPLLLESKFVVFNELIEDELILAIPDIPVHDGCEHKRPVFADDDFETTVEPSPFAILAKLKSKEN